MGKEDEKRDEESQRMERRDDATVDAKPGRAGEDVRGPGGGRGGSHAGHGGLGVKIALDVVMCLVLVLLYKAKVLTLTFHEVAGLAILGLFAIHCLLNRKWVVNVGRRLFSPQTPLRTKVSYWLAIALAVDFVLIVVSGVFISKVLFKNALGGQSGSTAWRNMHLFCSALSLILVGMHVGLYWDKITGFFRKRCGKLRGAGIGVARVVLVVVLAFGVYSIPTTSFAQWLACPVVPMQHPSHGDSQQGGDQTQQTEGSDSGSAEGKSGHAGHGAAGSSQVSDASAAADKSAVAERSSDASSASDGEATGSSVSGHRGHGADDASASGSADASGSDASSASTARDAGAAHGDAGAESDSVDGSARGDASGGRVGSDTDGETGSQLASGSSADGSQESDASAAAQGHSGKSGNHGTNVTVGGVLQTIAQFMSIIAVFAAITYWVDRAIKRRGRGTRA